VPEVPVIVTVAGPVVVVLLALSVTVLLPSASEASPLNTPPTAEAIRFPFA